jgi:hypothetical protein
MLTGVPGAGLFEDEVVHLAFDRSRGVVDGAEGVKNGFVLTSRRLVYIGGSGYMKRTGSASLDDVKYVEVVQRGRSLKALFISFALVASGAALGWFSTFDVLGASIEKLTVSAGLDQTQGDIGGMVDGMLGGFTSSLNQSMQLGAIALLLLGPLVFLYYLVSGETTLGASVGGEQVRITIARSQARKAQAFITAFFKCKAAHASRG